MRIRFLRGVIRTLFSLLSDLHVEGLENVPLAGPCILTVNHISYFDIALIFAHLGGDDVATWAAEKYERHWLFGPLLRVGRVIFIQRGEVDRAALDAAVGWLRAGMTFGVAPEGTRSRNATLLRAKTGVAYLAYETHAAIVPIAVFGTETIGRDLLRLRRPHVNMRIGPVYFLPAPDPEARAASLRRDADEVMCRIAALLPSTYRGAYADHPRLKELLSRTA
jgi:1-acyl-sn-glycerol-3-phosphate acyltransferase